MFVNVIENIFFVCVVIRQYVIKFSTFIVNSLLWRAYSFPKQQYFLCEPLNNLCPESKAKRIQFHFPGGKETQKDLSKINGVMIRPRCILCPGAVLVHYIQGYGTGEISPQAIQDIVLLFEEGE